MAAAAAAVAIAFNMPWLRDRPYLLPVAAVAFAAWLGGFRAAMVAAGMYAEGELDPAKAVSLEFVNKGVGRDLASTPAK